jgi:parvulin-like peptidyl-prolyl isomerase
MLIPLKILLSVFVTLYSGGLSGSYAQQVSDFQVESSVNGEVITNFDLEQRILLLKLFNISAVENETEVMKQLIDERLQFQFTERQSIFLTSEEIDNSINDFLLSRSLQKIVLRNELKKNGLEWQSFTSYVVNKNLWKKALIQLYATKAKISNYELNLPSQNSTLTVKKLLKLSEIVIPFSERGKDKALLLAKRLGIELNAGNDFTTAARRFSRSQTSSSGGQLDFIEENRLPITLKRIVGKLSIGETTGPIILDNTVVLFKLNARLNKKILPVLDYFMTYITGSEENIEGVSTCNNKKKYKSKSTLLSNLGEEESRILSSSQLYEVIYLPSKSWIVLCNRIVKGKPEQINKKKAKYFNNKMIKFSQKLMLKLYREAIIS